MADHDLDTDELPVPVRVETEEPVAVFEVVELAVLVRDGAGLPLGDRDAVSDADKLADTVTVAVWLLEPVRVAVTELETDTVAVGVPVDDAEALRLRVMAAERVLV